MGWLVSKLRLKLSSQTLKISKINSINVALGKLNIIEIEKLKRI
jgi:hypothetical protein